MNIYITCIQCKKELLSNSARKFCGKSCAAIYNNARRSAESRLKQITSIKNNPKIYRKKQKTYSKVTSCCECGRFFPSTGNKRKTCSEVCRKILQSKIQSEILRQRHRNATYPVNSKKSKMEEMFEVWLDKRGIEYEPQMKIYNHELKKYYYADFAFHHLNLIIELDGTQHNLTKEKDRIRDDYISRILKYKVVRITAPEFFSKSRLDEIKKLLQTE